jgi:aminoacrylate hydrolase
MPRVEIVGGSLNFETAGRGEPLLFISGLNGIGSFWHAQTRAFSSDFHTITFDHRGIGQSTGAPPYSAEQWADDVIALLDHLRVGSAVLIGHSTGGVIAQVVASEHPQRVASVVLSGTWAQPDDRFRRVFELRRQVLTALGTEAYAVLGSIITAPPDEPFGAVEQDGTDPAIVKARIDALLQYSGLERLRRIRCPALVLAAEDDILIPAYMSRIVAKGIAGAELTILDSGSHAFPRSRAADYNRLVLEFLSRYQRPPTTKPSEMTSVTHTARESSHE